ncbi:MAG: tRNA (adenosine(37)-N6)-dimethylallyltransferase MiaA [Clostridiales bacterium]|nr:tRNA (adenosine(37)-N6)-dimethylallyltransferase MiaA [Clostridiales bacterium]
MVQAHRIKAIALVGCTAVGKSDTAIRLAKRFNGAIVGADSMQIYRGFDIGTGKLKQSERGGVEHSMIDIVDGDASFSVGEYVELAAKEIDRIHAGGKLPIVVGGTGLYVNSLFSGYNFAGQPKNDDVRTALKISSHFVGCMHELLALADDKSAGDIARNDVKRTLRALEIYYTGGKPKSAAVTVDKPYDDLSIVLTLPRETLYEKINARVHAMFDDGLIEETIGLLKYKNCQAMQALGYKQIAESPDTPREELEALVAQKTRNYAKRQMTYFNNMKLHKVFIDARDYDSIEKCVATFLGDGNE